MEKIIGYVGNPSVEQFNKIAHIVATENKRRKKIASLLPGDIFLRNITTAGKNLAVIEWSETIFPGFTKKGFLYDNGSPDVQNTEKHLKYIMEIMPQKVIITPQNGRFNDGFIGNTSEDKMPVFSQQDVDIVLSLDPNPYVALKALIPEMNPMELEEKSVAIRLKTIFESMQRNEQTSWLNAAPKSLVWNFTLPHYVNTAVLINDNPGSEKLKIFYFFLPELIKSEQIALGKDNLYYLITRSARCLKLENNLLEDVILTEISYCVCGDLLEVESDLGHFKFEYHKTDKNKNKLPFAILTNQNGKAEPFTIIPTSH